MIRRHRLIETFLVETLGYTWDRVHDQAAGLGHIRPHPPRLAYLHSVQLRWAPMPAEPLLLYSFLSAERKFVIFSCIKSRSQRPLAMQAFRLRAPQL